MSRNQTGKSKGTIVIDGCDEMRDRSNLEQYFRDAVSYDILLEEYSYDKETLEGILFLLVDTCSTKKKVIRICGKTNLRRWLKAS